MPPQIHVFSIPDKWYLIPGRSLFLHHVGLNAALLRPTRSSCSDLAATACDCRTDDLQPRDIEPMFAIDGDYIGQFIAA
jgi:hypothetical protein